MPHPPSSVLRVKRLVLVFMLALPAQAQTSGLDRLTTREHVLGWEAVGRLDLPNGFCTGVLVATDLVLTAAHCMYDVRTGTYIDPAGMRFRAGLADGSAIAERRGRRQVSHPAYLHGLPVTPENVRHDVALVQLDSAIPAAVAAPFVVAQIGGRGSRVSVVSYAAGRDEAPSWQRTCMIIGHYRDLIGFDCDVTFGASGAPVFDRSGQRARIVSLVSAGGGGTAFGMDLPRRLDEVKAALRSGRGVVEASGPAPSMRFTAPGERASGAGGAKFVPAAP